MSDNGLVPATLPKVAVIGCSGHARVVIDVLESEDRCHIIGLLDTYKTFGTEVLGYEVLGTDEDLPALLAADIIDSAIVAIGDNWVRSQMVARIRKVAPLLRFVSVIHPSAHVAREVTIGEGTVIMPGVVVNTCSRIGKFCILNTNSSLDHDCIMGDYSSLAPRAVTGGGVTIGAFSSIAIGAVVSHEINIGEHTVIGAGSTVVKDIPDSVVAYGTPARVVRRRNYDDTYLVRASSKEISPPRPPKSPAFVRSLQSLMLIPATSSGWCTYLERTKHDFFHTAQYHLAETSRGGEALLAVYGKGDKFVAWPYILRDIDTHKPRTNETFKDITSVYGYSGPIGYRCELGEPFLDCAWDAMIEAWRAESVVSVFARCHPLLENHKLLPIHNDGGGVVGPYETTCLHGKTVAIDLSRSQADLWNSYKRQLRQALHRMFQLGMAATYDPDWLYLNDFVRLYYGTMKRNHATPFYFFPNKYFLKLKEALGPHGSLMVTRYEGQTIGAALLIEYSGFVNVHLLSSDERFAHLSVSKLIVHEAQAWAQRRGNRFLHLGGGRGNRDDDSLFRFKRLFSEDTYPFYTSRWILDQEMYKFLVNERRKKLERLRSNRILEGHFPLYRTTFDPTDSAPQNDQYIDGEVNSPSSQVQLDAVVNGQYRA